MWYCIISFVVHREGTGHRAWSPPSGYLCAVLLGVHKMSPEECTRLRGAFCQSLDSMLSLSTSWMHVYCSSCLLHACPFLLVKWRLPSHIPLQGVTAWQPKGARFHLCHTHQAVQRFLSTRARTPTPSTDCNEIQVGARHVVRVVMLGVGMEWGKGMHARVREQRRLYGIHLSLPLRGPWPMIWSRLLATPLTTCTSTPTDNPRRHRG